MKSDLLRTTRCTAMAISAALALFLFAAAAPAGASSEPITISVLSGRADLVSGGDALVRIGGVSSTQGLKVTVGGADQTNAFAKRADGTVVGLVRGPEARTSTIIARAGARAAQFDGHQPPEGRPGLLRPAAPAVEVPGDGDGRAVQRAAEVQLRLQVDQSEQVRASSPTTRPTRPRTSRTTTTDKGVTRAVHRARRDRLHRPRPVPDRRALPARQAVDAGRAAAAVQPQAADHPRRRLRRRPPDRHRAGGHRLGEAERGARRAASRRCRNALDNAGHNCNLASEAESLMMTKEYLIERYGTLRYTIGTGCSGGSLAQQWIANAYPGVYQGILPTCSFPDAWSTATQFLDYHQTLRYFDDPSKWGAGVTWTPQQMADVAGLTRAIANSQRQRRRAVPRRRSRPTRARASPTRSATTRRPTRAACAARSRTRRSTSSARGPMSLWTPQEKQIGHGFAGVPTDNVGVQYGLRALQQRHRSRPPSSSTSTRRSAASIADANHTARTDARRPARRSPTPTAAA